MADLQQHADDSAVRLQQMAIARRRRERADSRQRAPPERTRAARKVARQASDDPGQIGLFDLPADDSFS